MYAITGITGKVGGTAAATLLDSGCAVRAVLRDPAKAGAWRERGAEIGFANFHSAAALVQAFQGAKGVFILLPPIFDPDPAFAEARAMIANIRAALETARPDKVVCLSTIGAEAEPVNLLSQLGLLELALQSLPMPIAFLRAGWFIDNAAWDVEPARMTGVIPSFLQPLDRAVPMVSTLDVGRAAARLLRESWTGMRVVNLEGPRRLSPNDIAAAFSCLLDKPVKAAAVARQEWEALFRAQGMSNPLPRMRMLDGFNEGWISFSGETVKGRVGLEEALRRLLA
jgi:uncharacterized protein YbjT (DUF2867 family)